VTQPQGTTDHMEQRPDGARIHWAERGAGPSVAMVHLTLWSYPGVYAALIADLSSDHRVLIPDPRGCGQSSRSGPYDMETDAGDLEAVLEAAGGGAVVIAAGDGLNRAVRVAPARPDLISHVVAIAPAPAAVLPRSELAGSGVLAASDSVIEMMLRMMSVQPRAALREMIATVNPDLGEEQLRERVEVVADYLTPEAGTERARSWLEDDVREQMRMLGGRLVIVHGGADPLLGGELAGRVTELFPAAQVEELADGPVSRPELTAARVRRLTGPASD
jgi:pimeloyl-ACP methyl ester carboxylesterase